VDWYNFSNSFVEWQGGQHPITWPTPEDEDEPEVTIEPSRLPIGVTSFLGPDYWDTELTLRYYEHLLAGQRRELPNDRILQYSRVNSHDVPNVLQTEIHPDSGLRYDGASRLFVAHVLRKAAGDTVALREIVGQLPPVLGANRTLLDPEDEEEVMKHAGDNIMLQNLVRYTMDYEQGRPMQVCTILFSDQY
jgi:hypothetical protein